MRFANHRLWMLFWLTACVVAIVLLSLVVIRPRFRGSVEEVPRALFPPIIVDGEQISPINVADIHVTYVALDGRGSEYFLCAIQLASGRSPSLITFAAGNDIEKESTPFAGSIQKQLPDFEQWEPYLSARTRNDLNKFSSSASNRVRIHRRPQGTVGGVYREWLGTHGDGTILYAAMGDDRLWFLNDATVEWVISRGRHVNSYAPADYGTFQVFEVSWSK